MKNLDKNKWEQKYELQKIKNATSLMKKRTEKFDGQDREREGESIRDVKVGRSVQDGTKNTFYKKYKNTKWDS